MSDCGLDSELIQLPTLDASQSSTRLAATASDVRTAQISAGVSATNMTLHVLHSVLIDCMCGLLLGTLSN